MKTPFLVMLGLAAGCFFSVAQNVLPPGPASVVARGPNHRTWQRVHERIQPNGKIVRTTNGYIEIAGGMHYQEEGEWRESEERIEIINGSAVARRGPHRVIFAANLNTAGSIDCLSPDNKRFRSHVLGILYSDSATGKSVPLAAVQNSAGGVLEPNQIYYLNAFDGKLLEADVRYT